VTRTFALNGELQSLGVPSHHTVGETCQRAGGSDQLLGAPAALGEFSKILNENVV